MFMIDAFNLLGSWVIADPVLNKVKTWAVFFILKENPKSPAQDLIIWQVLNEYT